ncbi:hypothetical protein [Archangium sp.]|uniref:hypothetical protein n=1 Tax=Archangium sp. TaxID=1872627 RepID=UPI002D22CE04|nr:hypothetical protein [Archangium sp.]HYO52369.1 hypothetical protein [Archangium sp.]
MPPNEPGTLIDLQQERLRRGMKRYHREPMQTWRRKVKLAVAGACLLGILASLLLIALESTDADPLPSSGGASLDIEDGPAWFTATGGGRR